jgi:hypothetical protein
VQRRTGRCGGGYPVTYKNPTIYSPTLPSTQRLFHVEAAIKRMTMAQQLSKSVKQAALAAAATGEDGDDNDDVDDEMEESAMEASS